MSMSDPSGTTRDLHPPLLRVGLHFWGLSATTLVAWKITNGTAHCCLLRMILAGPSHGHPTGFKPNKALMTTLLAFSS